MIKKLLFILLFTAFGFTEAQVGDLFPDMSCISLTEKNVKLPDDIKGKYTLIGVAYSKKSEEELKSWFKPVFYKFVYKPDNSTLFYEGYNVNLYFIPMFTGVNLVSVGNTTTQIKAQVDKKLHPYVLIYKGELKPYKDKLALSKSDIPYFFVLDEGGKIVYATSGAYSEQKMVEVEHIIDDF